MEGRSLICCKRRRVTPALRLPIQSSLHSLQNTVEEGTIDIQAMACMHVHRDLFRVEDLPGPAPLVVRQLNWRVSVPRQVKPP